MPSPPPPPPTPGPGSPARPSALARARLRRFRAELERVRLALEEWFKRRTTIDEQQAYRQYSAQLGGLQGALSQALKRITDELDGLSAQTASAGRIFAACAGHELRLAWVQRVAGYFQQKFDQRDNPTWSPLLKAADEIVWSCYKPVFASSDEPLRAAPLPYVEPLFTPNAILRDDPPRELFWNTDDAFARSCFAALPVPVIGLPASVRGAPWLLALLAHEVGHHVQADLDRPAGGAAGAAGAVRAFAERLRDAAEPGPGAGAWLARGREVFADLFSTLCIGPATLPVLTEVLFGEDRGMLMAGDARYPAPLIRLLLIRQTLQQLGLGAPPADPHGLSWEVPAGAEVAGPAAMSAADADPERLRRLAAAAAGWCWKERPLPEWLGWKPTATAAPAAAVGATQSSPELRVGGDLHVWSEALEAGEEPEVTPGLRSPRVLIGAGVLAWAELVQEPNDATREARLQHLGAQLLQQLPAVREQATRAATAEPKTATEAFAGALMTAPIATMTRAGEL